MKLDTDWVCSNCGRVVLQVPPPAPRCCETRMLLHENRWTVGGYTSGLFRPARWIQAEGTNRWIVILRDTFPKELGDYGWRVNGASWAVTSDGFHADWVAFKNWEWA